MGSKMHYSLEMKPVPAHKAVAEKVGGGCDINITSILHLETFFRTHNSLVNLHEQIMIFNQQGSAQDC
jgi:hypothetical protein